jgi:hypothetical protein
LVYTCSPARHLSRRYEVVPACGKVNRNTVPQGLLAAAHNRPPWELMSSAMGTRQAAGTACCIALFGPLSVRCFGLCPRRRRRQAFPIDRRCLHRGAVKRSAEALASVCRSPWFASSARPSTRVYRISIGLSFGLAAATLGATFLATLTYRDRPHGNAR